MVHSRTGNTLSVARKIQQALTDAGHEATLEQISAVDENVQDPRLLRLDEAPDVAPYDAVVLCGPVHGFSASQVMQAYLKDRPALKGKKAVCVVTQHLSKDWMGGNRAIRQMQRACREQGADVLEAGGIVHWSSPARQAQIEALVQRVAGI